jgi:Microcystin-dependent protein
LARLAIGTAGQQLAVNSGATAPEWVDSSGGAPVGSVTWYAANSPPTGWLECDGSAISRTTYADLFSAIGTTFGAGDGSTTFELPDLRGEFVRGWDNSRGVDSGRSFGSAQADDFESHTHSVQRYDEVYERGSNGVIKTVSSSTTSSGAAGGSETRPRNIALLPIIKY